METWERYLGDAGDGQNASCWLNNDPIKTIYYELNVTLNAEDKAVISKCKNNELHNIGVLLDDVLWELDLHNRYDSVIDVRNHVCVEAGDKNTKRPTARMRGLTVRQQWALSSNYIYFYVFRGGGRCRFCYGDNADWRGRQRERRTRNLGDADDAVTGTVTNGGIEGSPHELDRSDVATDAAIALASARSERRTVASNFVACGCQEIAFDLTDYGNPMGDKTPYLRKWYYHDLYGMLLWVNLPTNKDGEKLGYAPGNKPRIFNTANPGENDAVGDPDLGSPNSQCDGGGVGEGEGGGPVYWKDNKKHDNPGANCVPLGPVLIIQESDKDAPDDNTHGGTILFQTSKDGRFITLDEIGLLDMGSSKSATITVYSKDLNGKNWESVFRPVGYGENAAETVKVYLKRVWKFKVEFKQSGAITHISYCHEGELEYCENDTGNTGTDDGLTDDSVIADYAVDDYLAIDIGPGDDAWVDGSAQPPSSPIVQPTDRPTLRPTGRPTPQPTDNTEGGSPPPTIDTGARFSRASGPGSQDDIISIIEAEAELAISEALLEAAALDLSFCLAKTNVQPRVKMVERTLDELVCSPETGS